MRKLSSEKRTMILSALVEGNSINATSRMTGASKVTILRLLVDVGSLCADLHDLLVRGLQTKRVQCDELWSFCGCKEKTKKRGARGHGDVWTWVAMDADSKVAISYVVADRGSEAAEAVMRDLADRVEGRIQLTTDGHRAYLDAVEAAFGGDVDYSMLVKSYAAERPQDAARYSPPRCTGCTKRPVVGNPDEAHVSTSFVERQNLRVRMNCRRFTRLTNAFSKRIENHVAAVHLHYFAYNWVRKHKTLKTTPAVASGLADRPLTMRDLVDLLEKEERVRGGRLTDYLPSPKAVSAK